MLLVSFLHDYLLSDLKIMSSDIFLYLAYLIKTYFVPLPTKTFLKLSGFLFCFLSFTQRILVTTVDSKCALICVKSSKALVQQPHQFILWLEAWLSLL